MEKVIENNVETRKEWAAPELKKVDIEQVTATGNSFFADLNGTAS
jgi:hypothetical protein